MAKEGDNSFGIASVVLGITGIVLSFFVYAGIALGIVGLIFGFIQMKKGKNAWASWGIALNIIGIALSLLLLWYYVGVAKEFARQVQELQASGAFPNQAAGGIAG